MLQIAITEEKASGQLSSGTMLLFVALLAAFPMLSTDLYLPAVPSIREQLNTTVGLVNSTLAVFFIFISISTLICGPLSDRFGRKPVLLSGVTLFFISSVACAVSNNFHFLIFSRVFQALGAGAGMAISSAIVKDFFPEDHRDIRLFGSKASVHESYAGAAGQGHRFSLGIDQQLHVVHR